MRRKSFPLAVPPTAVLVAVAAAVCFPAAAAAVPCAGGTLTISATSDTPVTPPTFNVGQRVMLSAVASGFAPSSFAWTIEGPHIGDYEDRLGTAASGAIAWSTTPLGPADLAAADVSFYWKPSPSQVHPLNGGPVPRAVSVEVAAGGVTCTESATFMVERNATDSSKQAVDYYTSNHRAAAETNPQKGRVIDDHIQWHTVFGSRLLPFLAWHGRFLARFDLWRQEFGYATEAAWYPGTPLPGGVEYAHTPRLASFDPDVNRIPTWFTAAGGSAVRPGGSERSLADFSGFSSFQNALEGSYHGQVHCDVGPGGFAGMCDYTSPKDPIFWRWHGFIDLMYRNYCGVAGIACESGPDPAADPWLGDNPPDIAANGAPPSPSPRWLSPDVWNRRAPVACTPADPTPGAVRDCGGSAQHENPVEGVENYLYATLRNDRPNAQRVAYAEVAVHIANASTGLAWPADFGFPLPETRQFVTINLEPGQVTDIGPLPWIPPSPMPSDHFCLYVRLLSPQDTLGAEGPSVDVNTRDSNSISWRNLKIVGPLATRASRSRFLVRNIRREALPIELELAVPEALLAAGRVELALEDRLLERWREAQGGAEGLRFDGRTFRIVEPKARLAGLPLEPREQSAVTVDIAAERGARPVAGEIHVVQRSRGEVDGGVTLALAAPEREERRLPDLVVDLSGPDTLRPGARIGDEFRLTVANKGAAPAAGTAEAGRRGYFVDLVLSTDKRLPAGFAVFSPRFVDDGLLRSGRVTGTRTLRPGERLSYPASAVIPEDTPPGLYCLGARVDPGDVVREEDEENNTTCHLVQVEG